MEEIKNESAPREQSKREQILAGAKKIFLQEGFAAASTDALAREAKVSKRTLYAYYPTKEELFCDVLRQLAFERPNSQILTFMQETNPNTITELRNALITLTSRLSSILINPEYLALLRTIIADSHRFPQLADIVRSTIPERGMSEIRLLLERAQTKGLIIHANSELMTRLFMGPLLSYALIDGMLRPSSPPQPPTHSHIEEIVDLYINAITVEHPPQRSTQ